MNERHIGRQIGDLVQQIQEYKVNPHNPEVVTQTWQKIWQVWGERASLTIPVSPCNWTEEEIQKPFIDIEGKPVPTMMIYRPEAIKDKEGFILLGSLFPQMDSFSVKQRTSITDAYDTTGWIKVEASIDVPNGNTTQKQVEDFFASQGRRGQRLSTYIIASQANKLFTGNYFDENTTISRLSGSRHGGRIQAGGVVHARFTPNGQLIVNWNLYPWDRHPNLGARFEEVKQI